MAADLRALLAEERRLWQELYRLTLAQGRALEPVDADKLLELLQQRGRCMTDLQALEEKFKCLVETAGGNDATEELGELRGKVLGEIKTLMEKTWQVDSENRRRLAACYASLKKEWENFQSGKEAALTYRGGRRVGRGYFVDANR
ncbi:flagellar export chaperone FlgN [Moorella sp. Hama-1]|uniref:flagellar export chaperone FlgN n=1 Tax=Moorella sp. Hama-1 TaxID=2138101 RepID=UPI001379BA7E|nr:flagellar export chaperone FlgN [Moorella sp. Hama-1]BCV20801.1 hypothetical protein hamaS1_08700 [Moorella sp. Hama-1]